MTNTFTTIKFLARYKSYLVGEEASFKSSLADALVNSGYASYVNPPESGDGARLKALVGPENTRHMAGPENTKSGAPARKCGSCGKVGHTKANCPAKK